MYKYTLGIIKRGNGILMLNLTKVPGGAARMVLAGKEETPEEGIIREVFEESRIILSSQQVIEKGTLTGGPFSHNDKVCIYS